MNGPLWIKQPNNLYNMVLIHSSRALVVVIAHKAAHFFGRRVCSILFISLALSSSHSNSSSDQKMKTVLISFLLVGFVSCASIDITTLSPIEEEEGITEIIDISVDYNSDDAIELDLEEDNAGEQLSSTTTTTITTTTTTSTTTIDRSPIILREPNRIQVFNEGKSGIY